MKTKNKSKKPVDLSGEASDHYRRYRKAIDFLKMVNRPFTDINIITCKNASDEELAQAFDDLGFDGKKCMIELNEKERQREEIIGNQGKR